MNYAEAVELEIDKQIKYLEGQLSQGSMKSFAAARFKVFWSQGASTKTLPIE